MTLPALTITAIVGGTSASTESTTKWIRRTLLAQAKPIRGQMSGESWTITQISLPHPRNQCLCTWATGCILGRVSRVAHISDYRSKTHASTAGHSPSSSQGMGMSTISPRLATISLPSPHVDSLSPVPTLPHDRRLSSHWMSGFTHLLSLVPSVPPHPYTVPVTPFLPYVQPQVTTNAGDLHLDFPAPAEGFRLPDVHPPPSYEECELSPPHSLNLTCVLTIHDLVWDRHNHQSPRPDPLHLDRAPFDRVMVSWTIATDHIIYLQYHPGCRRTRNPPSHPHRFLVRSPADQAACEGGAKVRPRQAGQEDARLGHRWLEPDSRQVPG